MNSLNIAIIGGGLAGLTSAIALAKTNHRVTVYEATAAWGDVGAGITLAPNAMCGLDYIGVGDEISQQGIEPSSQNISHWQDGQVLLAIERKTTREKYGSAYVYIHRADLHNILIKAAKQAGVKIQLAKQLNAVQLEGDSPVMHFLDDSTATADLVIGADGLKSEVRKLFETLPAKFSGHIAYRAIAQVTPEIQHLVDQPGMHIGPEKMVVRYPLRKGSLLNLVFFARQDGWTEDGWSIPAKASELYKIYDGWCADIQLLLNSTQADTIFKWAINQHQPLTTWSAQAKVTLVGDSAHAMTPFLGQGAAAGIEDAIILSRALAASTNINEALQRYETARLERTSLVMLESNYNADRLQGNEAELYGVSKLTNEETLGLFNYNCVNEPI